MKEDKIQVNFNVNGKAVSVTIDPKKTLLKVLREELSLTGTKEGCGKGECGACTVIMDNKVVNSCLIPICQAEGKEVLTIEGLGTPDQPHPIQKAFVETGAVQCGFCTPGMILSAKVLLDKSPSPAPEDIKESLSGNLCRCTGYTKIFQAVQRASRNLRKRRR